MTPPSPAGFQFCPLGPEHLAELAAFRKRCSQAAPADVKPLSLAKARLLLAELARPGSESFAIAAFGPQGRMAAHLIARADAARNALRIQLIAVDPGLCRLGLGSALLALAQDAALRLGLTEIDLVARDLNHAAARFYLQNGYARQGPCGRGNARFSKACLPEGINIE